MSDDSWISIWCRGCQDMVQGFDAWLARHPPPDSSKIK